MYAYGNEKLYCIVTLGFLANVLWKSDLNININSMMQLKMFSDLQSHQDLPLLPLWFRSLVIDKEKINNLIEGSMVNITFDTRTNVIRGPGIEIEALRTSVFPEICSPPINLNIQKVQFFDQPNSNIHVICFINILLINLMFLLYILIYSFFLEFYSVFKCLLATCQKYVSFVIKIKSKITN